MEVTNAVPDLAPMWDELARLLHKGKKVKLKLSEVSESENASTVRSAIFYAMKRREIVARVNIRGDVVYVSKHGK